MLGLAEYVAVSASLKDLAQSIEQKTTVQLSDVQNKQTAIAITRQLADEYQDEYEKLLYDGLLEVADTTATYHTKRLGSSLNPVEIAKKVLGLQLGEDYFGLSLAKRLFINHRRLVRNINNSAQVGIDKLSDVYTKTVPFGSQYNIDRRVLLGYMVKVEQEVAKEIARQEGRALIRWTLSHRHRQTDICDDIATNIDPKVVEYLRENNIDADPRGLYFVDDLPNPPHPNCQCEHHIFAPDVGKPTRIRRTAQKLRNIVRRLLRRK